MELNKEYLIEKIKVQKHPDVVTMHDFFLDHFVTYLDDGGAVDSFINRLNALAKLGGGQLTTQSRQQILRGGKGFNSASALSALGAKVHFISKTSSLGLYLMKYFLKDMDVDLSHVTTDGEMAVTTAIEMKYKGRMFNAMVSYPGSVSNFVFEDLTPEALKTIEATDCLLLASWYLNLKGTEFAEKLFNFAANAPCIKFYDPGDPSGRSKDIPELMERVLLKSNFNVLGVNESEAIYFASYFNPGYLKRKGDIEKLGLECASTLAEKLKKRVDLHTVRFSATLHPNGERIIVPTYKVDVLRVTGAGDSWQAANAYGELIGLNDHERLMFANAVAAFYISNPEGKHGRISDIIRFINKHSLNELTL
jgi:sugar/nucleoside kinase (ribokinase family)